MRVTDTPTGHDYLTDVGMITAGAILQEEEVGRLGDDDPAIGERETRRDIQVVRENRKLIGLAVDIRVLSNNNLIVTLMLVCHDAVGVI